MLSEFRHKQYNDGHIINVIILIFYLFIQFNSLLNYGSTSNITILVNTLLVILTLRHIKVR